MSKNTNRDYIIIIDVKSSDILEADTLQFYINDNESHNIFVQLVIKDTREPINKYVSIDDPSKYVVKMNIVKPTNEHETITSELVSVEDSLYQFVLPNSCVNNIGTYRCEVETCYNNRVTNSNKIKYKIKKSVLNDLDSVVKAPGYPIIVQLLDKLSDIEKYEEDRRAAELARQLAEEQRKTNYDELVADMTDSIEAIDNKVVDVENRITVKEQAVDTLITETKDDIYNYKVAKDQEIDDYKTSKDTEINEAITAQDNKIDEAISNQNDRIALVENNVVTQNNRLDVVENKNTQQDNRLTTVEGKNVEQDNRLNEIEAIDVSQNSRLDAIEAKNQQQDDRLLDIEKVNKQQAIDIKCLFTEAKNNMMDITKEGNSIYLQNSTIGYTLIDEIKGNTLVNCNKEPDKEIVLNGNINTKGYSNVTLTEGVDGGLVDVALEGNTMVNVCNQRDSVALPFDQELTYLYANTQYAVQFTSDKAITVDITLGGTELLAQPIIVGLNKITITTPSTLADNKLIINGVGANISNIVVTEATDQDFGYFEGMKSVGECEDLELLARTENLVGVSKLLEGINSISYSIVDDSTNTIKVKQSSYPVLFIPAVEVGVNYTLSLNVSKNTDIAFEDGLAFSLSTSKSVYPNDSYWVIYTNKTVPSGIVVNLPGKVGGYYIRSSIEVIFSNIMLTYSGISYSKFIPAKSNTQTLTHEPLRAVGDVKDKYVLIDGKWYIERNCGEITFDGSEDEWWEKCPDTNWETDTHIAFRTTIPSMIINNWSSSSVAILDKFKTIKANGSNYGDSAEFSSTDSGMLNIKILKSKLVTQNVEGFKQWLQSNPVKAIYQLATPTYEPINYNPFTVYSSTTHISNNSTIPCNMTIKNTGYNCLLKPSTTYTVSSNLGLNVVTTPSVLTEDCLRFYDTDTSTITTMKDVTILEGDYTTGKPLPSHFSGIESAFEQEYDEAVGKYKVKIRVQNEDASRENYIEFYIDEPLRGVKDVKDKVYIKNDKVVVERNCGQREYQDGDFGTYLTDKVSTVYQLSELTYEEVEYNDVKLFIESFKNSTLSYDSNIPVTSTITYTYSVPLVDTAVQTAQTSDEQDQLIIDLATQCAVMEIMLM